MPKNKGIVTTPENPGDSRLMNWLAAHLDYPHKDWCLIWPFGSKRLGYAFFIREGKSKQVHRYMCERRYGPAPEGHIAAHTCGNGHLGCVNPNHVFWATNSQNQLMRTDRGQRSKLTRATAAEIRALKGKEPPRVTAIRFGVSESAIKAVQAGRTWNESERRRSGDLSAEEVLRIRTMLLEKPSSVVAREMGLRPQTISHIKNGKYYKHVRAP